MTFTAMMMAVFRNYLIVFFIWSVGDLARVFAVTPKDLGSIQRLATRIDAETLRIKKHNDRYFKSFQRNDRRVERKLCRLNAPLADHLMSRSADPLRYIDKLECLGRPDTKAPNRQYNPELDSMKALIQLRLECDSQLTINERSEYEKLIKSIADYEATINSHFYLQQQYRSRKLLLTRIAKDQRYLSRSAIQMDKLNYYSALHQEKAVSAFRRSLGRGIEALWQVPNQRLFSGQLTRQGALGSLATPTFSSNQSEVGKLQTVEEVRKQVEECYAKQNLGKTIQDLSPIDNAKTRLNEAKTASRGMSGMVAADLPTLFTPNAEKGKPLFDRIDFGVYLNPKIDRMWRNIEVSPRLSIIYNHSIKLMSLVGVSDGFSLLSNAEARFKRVKRISISYQIEYRIIGAFYVGAGLRSCDEVVRGAFTPFAALALRRDAKSPRPVLSITYDMSDISFRSSDKLRMSYGIEF